MTGSASRRVRAGFAPPVEAEDRSDEVAAFARSQPFLMSRVAFAGLAGGCLAPATTRSAGAGAEFGRIAYLQNALVTVPVHGLLVPRDNWMTAYYAATSYESILQDVTQAMTAPRVRGIVLDVSSYGGTMHGCWELAEGMLALRGTKPMHAHVRGDGHGAAYWIAAATDRIHAAETAVLGDLGLQASYLDTREWFARHGLAEVVVTSAQTPAKNAPPTTPVGVSAWQRTADDLADVMLRSIAGARSTTVESLRRAGGDGGLYVGARAMSLGLADALGDTDAVSARVHEAVASRVARAPTATTNRTATAAPPRDGTAPTRLPTPAERILAALRLHNPSAVIAPTK